MVDGQVDYEKTCKMVDTFLQNGFNYFETAHGYLGGKSEAALRKCLEVCRKHGKPAIIMEPVKGGSLVNLSDDAQKVFDELGGGFNASYAIRFAASQEGVMMSSQNSVKKRQVVAPQRLAALFYHQAIGHLI